LAERVLDPALNGTLEWPGSERLVIALVNEEIDGALRERDPIADTARRLTQQDLDDLRDVLLVERMEDDHIVETVEEFGIEDLGHLFLDRVAHPLEGAFAVGGVEAERLARHEVACTD